jgi:hypothetical protein
MWYKTCELKGDGGPTIFIHELFKIDLRALSPSGWGTTTCRAAVESLG